MDAGYWHEKWAQNRIAFHMSAANPLLVRYFDALHLPEGARVFLPLCGKTLDIPWLMSRGCRIAGAELSELAIGQLFDGLGVTPGISEHGGIRRFSAPGIDIFAGDIFDLSADLLGPVEAVYDRAALVALPEEMRRRYTAHLMQITHRAPQLLVTCEYDQRLMEGPPFSVSGAEVERHYRGSYALTHLLRADTPGGIRGKCPAMDNVWLLVR